MTTPRRFLGLDLETTGLDVNKDQILKLGAVLYEEGNPTPHFEKEFILWSDYYPEIHPDALRTHGISKKSVQEFGESPYDFFQMFARLIDEHKIEYLVAHNGNHFDFPLLIQAGETFAAGLLNFFRRLKKIDTKTDIKYPPNIKQRGLVALAAEHGFLNPFPHSALSDVRTMMKIFFQYPINDTIARSQSKTVMIRALVHYEERDKAKAEGFRWEADRKFWLKEMKECDINKFEFPTEKLG